MMLSEFKAHSSGSTLKQGEEAAKKLQCKRPVTSWYSLLGVLDASGLLTILP